jgi:thiaminase/transcriptional activator TenA
MRFTDELRDGCLDTWRTTVDHRFPRDLSEDTAPPQALRYYFLQRAQLMDSVVALFGAAVATAGSYPSRVALAHRLDRSLQQGFYASASRRLGVGESQRLRPEFAVPTAAFRSLMDTARRSGIYSSCLAVLTAADWLRSDWSAALKSMPTHAVTAEWLGMLADPEFTSWVGWLRAELDRTAATLDDAERRKIAGTFTEVVRLELAFFDSAYSVAR